MDYNLDTTIEEFQNNVQQIFECESNLSQLKLNPYHTNAEIVLVEHLLKAYDLINARGTD